MAYRGNFSFTDESDFINGDDNCHVCGRSCVVDQGFYFIHGDTSGYHDDYDLEKQCDCTERQLRVCLDEDLYLDKWGRKIMDLLLKLDTTSIVEEIDLIQLSERINRSFYEMYQGAIFQVREMVIKQCMHRRGILLWN